MPILYGFIFPTEELQHGKLTLSQETIYLLLKRGIPKIQYIQSRKDSNLVIIALFAAYSSFFGEGK